MEKIMTTSVNSLPPPPPPPPTLIESSKALRYNSDKPMVSLVLEANYALCGAAKVLEYGMKKYSRSNWKKGLDDKEILDSLTRHMLKYLSGELIDPETQCPHVDHILCNALFLSDQYNGLKDAETVG